MIVISHALALTQGASVNARNPAILWETVIDRTKVAADQEAIGYPATNLVNPSTYERWTGEDTSDQYIVFDTNGARVDAIGLARHNFGSGNVVVSVEAHDGDEDWTEILEEFLPANDSPLLLRFVEQHATQIRVKLQPDTTIPTIAVAVVGALLVMPRGIVAPHVPLNLARSRQVVNGRSESGNFLGRVITGQSNATSAQFQGLERDWYFANFEPFVDRATAFFFTWLPEDRPQDVGYCWLSADPKPSFHNPMRGVDVTVEFGGVVL